MFAHIHSIIGSGSSCKICKEYPGTETPRAKDSGKRRVLQYIKEEDSLITIFFLEHDKMDLGNTKSEFIW